MNLTDPVADMLTRIRNACAAGHKKVDIPRSKLKVEVARIRTENLNVRFGKTRSFQACGHGIGRLGRVACGIGGIDLDELLEDGVELRMRVSALRGCDQRKEQGGGSEQAVRDHAGSYP